MATSPSSIDSVRRLAISKLEYGAGPPWMPATHSAFMPSSPPPLRGSVGAGFL